MSNNPDFIVIGAGLVSLAGNWHESGSWPGENGIKIVAATAALATIFAVAKNTKLAPAVSALAILILLGAIYRYVPAFRNPHKKEKTNG